MRSPSLLPTLTPASRPVRPVPAGSRAQVRGFTLLEVLITIAILGLLVGLVVTKLGGVFGTNQEKIAQLFVQSSMKTSLMQYRIDMSDYPTTTEGMQSLLTAPAAHPERWKGPYIETNSNGVPLDPWGEPYQYAYPGTHN